MRVLSYKSRNGGAENELQLLAVLCLYVASTALAAAAFLPGAYQTLPGATVEEWGDRVPNGRRAVPLFATLVFDFNTGQPSLTAFITNAVLEGGDPFPLTVRSASSSQLSDGAWRFTGDYLRDIYPSGSQYLFDWTFSASTNGELLWNGTTAWAGGHAWYVTISNLNLVPVPWLDIARAGIASVELAWATNFPSHVLEYTDALPAPAWTTVTNAATNAGTRLSVTLETAATNRFYRLRKP